MNTTDYFTYINAMFLFCILTCGLLVWAVIWGHIIKGKLTKEQDSHLKATNTNTLLNKALSAKNVSIFAAEHKLRDAEKEIRGLQFVIEQLKSDFNKCSEQFTECSNNFETISGICKDAISQRDELQAKLDHAEADRIELRAERATLENKLTDALAKVRKRDKDGKFLPSGNRRVKKVKAVSDAERALDEMMSNPIEQFDGMTVKPKLIHGLTVKNPTEDEAKMIFDEARRLGVLSKNECHKITERFTNLWYYSEGNVFDGVSACLENVSESQTFVTAQEFVQRMQNGRG